MGALTVGNDREKDVKKPWNSNHDWSIPEKRGKLAIEDVSLCEMAMGNRLQRRVRGGMWWRRFSAIQCVVYFVSLVYVV